MNKVGIFKSYPIQDFYYAEIKKTSSPKKEMYTTLLLKKGNEYIDLFYPNRKLKIIGDSGYTIEWKNMFCEYCNAYGWERLSSVTVIRALLFFLKNKTFLEDQNSYFRARRRGLDLEERISLK